MEEEIRNRLKHAQEYEEKQLPLIPAAVLPACHLTGGIGWINDPNGFSVYRGEYHLFFQYYPYDTSWGDMYWGHVKSHDLIHWERLPIALAPDEDYDLDGCFSGSALETTDGKHIPEHIGFAVKKKEICSDRPNVSRSVTAYSTQNTLEIR